jgi:hypothetical protein
MHTSTAETSQQQLESATRTGLLVEEPCIETQIAEKVLGFGLDHLYDVNAKRPPINVARACQQ